MPRRRTRRACRLALPGVLAALAHGAAAADAEGQYGVRGAALASCEVYEAERAAQSEVYNVIASWMDGYITGINQHAADTYDIASFESTELIAALVSEHCKQHPETPVFAVVNALVKEFGRRRLRGPSEKIVVMGGENEVLLYAEVVRRIQDELANAGLYTSRLDGTYNEATREAMRAFQRSIELEPTGFPDQLTLWRLFNDESEGAR